MLDWIEAVSLRGSGPGLLITQRPQALQWLSEHGHGRYSVKTRLAALIGPQRVKEMLLLARMIDGPTALGVGLVSELLPDVPALHARAAELAQTVAGHAPITLKVTKEALRRLQARLSDENIDDLIRLAYGSADFREGMAAFLGKRAPKWTGT